MAHSILLAAALLIGGSSELRKASLLTVSLFDEKDDNSSGKQAAFAGLKHRAETLVRPKATIKPANQLPAVQESIPKQSQPPLSPVKTQSDAGSGFAPGLTGTEAQSSSTNGGTGPSTVGGQALTSGSGELGSTSASRRQKGQATDPIANASLKQKIRDALQANLVYPYIARKRRMEGTVHMEFRINERGLPEGVRIVKGSSYAILDEAARETVIKASPFPARDNIIEVPIRFSLRGD